MSLSSDVQISSFWCAAGESSALELMVSTHFLALTLPEYTYSKTTSASEIICLPAAL